jgi:hypothetical protein
MKEEICYTIFSSTHYQPTIMKFQFLLLLGLLSIGTYSCSEDDLTQLNPNLVTPENYFNTAGELEAAVLSGYGTLRAQHLTARHYFFLNDLMDDHHIGTSALQIAPELVRGQQVPASIHIRQLFDAYYDLVHRENTALDGIYANETVDEDIKRRLEAEARFLRGWAYNEIATLWGGAPIYTTRSVSLEDFQPRSPREEVFAIAQSDLRFAVDNLPVDRPDGEIGRADKGAAMGFLARSLMQSGDVAAAKTVLQGIVDLDKYKLLENFGDNFTEENAFLGEALFEVIFAPNGGYNWSDSGNGTNTRSIRAQEYGPNWRNVVPTSAVMEAFPAEALGDPYTDPRLSETIIFEGQSYANGTETLQINPNSPPEEYGDDEVFANFYKYGLYYKQNPGNYRETDANFILMRYADVLLLLAEAEARTNGDLQKARDLINQVRERAGAPTLDEAGVDNGTAEEVLDAVINERELELVGEQVRSRDLRRWHAAGIVDAEQILGYAEEKFLLPIPEEEITNNPMIGLEDQNSGYN